MTVILPPAQADVIRRTRKARKWNQLELARKAGVDRGVVFRAENLHPIEVGSLRLLADALGLPADELLSHAEVPPTGLPTAKASATRAALQAYLDFLDELQQDALLHHLRYEWRVPPPVTDTPLVLATPSRRHR